MLTPIEAYKIIKEKYPDLQVTYLTDSKKNYYFVNAKVITNEQLDSKQKMKLLPVISVNKEKGTINTHRSLTPYKVACWSSKGLKHVPYLGAKWKAQDYALRVKGVEIIREFIDVIEKNMKLTPELSKTLTSIEANLVKVSNFNIQDLKYLATINLADVVKYIEILETETIKLLQNTGLLIKLYPDRIIDVLYKLSELISKIK